MIFYVLIQNMISKAICNINTEMKTKEIHRSSDLDKFQQEEMNKKETAENQLLPRGQPAKRDSIAKFLLEMIAFYCCFRPPLQKPI